MNFRRTVRTQWFRSEVTSINLVAQLHQTGAGLAGIWQTLIIEKSHSDLF
jgi:hypothetical protein